LSKKTGGKKWTLKKKVKLAKERKAWYFGEWPGPKRGGGKEGKTPRLFAGEPLSPVTQQKGRSEGRPSTFLVVKGIGPKTDPQKKAVDKEAPYRGPPGWKG